MSSKERFGNDLSEIQNWQAPQTGQEADRPLDGVLSKEERDTFPLEERAKLWVEFERLTSEEKRRLFQADGFFALHACIEPEEVFKSGKLLSTQDQNVAAGSDPLTQKFLYPSKAVHFSMNSVYYKENRYFGKISDDPELRAKWFSGVAKDRDKAILPTQRAGFLIHPGILMTRKFTSENGLQLSSLEVEDLAVRDEKEGTGIPIEWSVFLVPKNQSVDPETGLPSSMATKEQWDSENHIGKDGVWYDSKTGVMSFPPGKFSITSEQYWQEKVEVVKARSGQVPDVFFYDGTTFEEGVDQWRKSWEVPSPNLNKFKETLMLFGQEKKVFQGGFASGGGQMYTAVLGPEVVNRVLEANR